MSPDFLITKIEWPAMFLGGEIPQDKTDCIRSQLLGYLALRDLGDPPNNNFYEVMLDASKISGAFTIFECLDVFSTLMWDKMHRIDK